MTKIVFRPARPTDELGVVDLAVESVSRDPLPVRVSISAMRETIREVVGKPAHFAWVAEQDGKIVASVIAQSSYGFWFERQQCSVLLYYTRVAGAGLPLIRQFARWVKSRPVIKIAVFELEPNADPRLVRLLQRIGFGRMSTNMAYVRNA